VKTPHSNNDAIAAMSHFRSLFEESEREIKDAYLYMKRASDMNKRFLVTAMIEIMQSMTKEDAILALQKLEGSS
jgi:hypothetical protein